MIYQHLSTENCRSMKVWRYRKFLLAVPMHDFVDTLLTFNFLSYMQRGIYVAGLREEIVASPQQVLGLMEFGECIFYICLFLFLPVLINIPENHVIHVSVCSPCVFSVSLHIYVCVCVCV